MVKRRKATILDIVYHNYNKITNMTLKELKAWQKNPLSKKASLSRKPLYMAIKLKSRPKRSWSISDIKWVIQKAIPYLKRAKKIKSRSYINSKGIKNPKKYTRNQIFLKNMGYDVRKKN